MFTGDAKIPRGVPYSLVNHSGVQMSIIMLYVCLCMVHLLAASCTPMAPVLVLSHCVLHALALGSFFYQQLAQIVFL